MRSEKLRNRLGALVLVAFLAASAPARASYTVLTAVNSVTAPGATVLTLPTSGSFAIDAGSIAYGHGGVGLMMPSGVTIYLINTLSTLNPGPIPGSPSEQIYVVAPTGVTDGSTVSFTIGYGINGATNSFLQSGSVTLAVSGGVGSYLTAGSSPISPNYTSEGLTFSATSLSRNGDVNSLSNGSSGLSIIATPAAVPEPASVAMLGLGLAGFAGFSARLRRAK